MRELLIASNNQGKIAEIKQVLAGLDFEVISRDKTELPDEFDPEETGTTAQENAAIKAIAYAEETGLATLADDSGLAVEALDGRPGVYSKRYGATDYERNQRLLNELKDTPAEKRTARFVCALCFYDPESKKKIEVEGVVEGTISFEEKGEEGFGYDPVFIPTEIEGDQTFAQLGTDVKNTVSHRARALKKLRDVISETF